jgi:hypothetical protein
MATGELQFPAECWYAPDGTTNNIPANGPILNIGSQATRKAAFYTIDFDGAGAVVESRHIAFRMPVDYSSGGSLIIQWFANATTNAVVWQAQLYQVDAADTDTPLERAYATAATVTTNVNTTEANRLNESTIDLSAVMDSVAAGDEVHLVIFRDPGNGSDTSTADARMTRATFQYTTA